MTNYNDGKIHGWNGGDCPVHPKSVVQVWIDYGATNTKEASLYSWAHIGKADIVAFKVIKEHREPKYMWVNEYQDHAVAYGTEENARKYVSSGFLRKAVKYKEVTEEDEV